MAEEKYPIPEEAEDKFDVFLRERFAALRRELDSYMAANKLPRAGQPKAVRRGAFSGRWIVGVAALLLVAVLVPLVVQINQRQEQMRSAALTTETPASEKMHKSKITEDESEIKSGRPSAEEVRQITRREEGEQRQQQPPRTREPAPAFKTRAHSPEMAGDAEGSGELTEKPVPAVTKRATEPAMGARKAKSDDQSSGRESPPAFEIGTRSTRIDDSQFRLKEGELAEIEKAEMERLWQEYKQNPEVFTKDTKKTERLKLLLTRYDASRLHRLKIP